MLASPPPPPSQVWPGNLLHGVLPGALQQADPQEGSPRDRGGGAPQSLEDDQPAGPGPPGADAAQQAQPWRTTLVLVWWHGDPREALRAGQGPLSSGPEEARASGSGGSSAADSDDIGGPASSRLRPMMDLPFPPQEGAAAAAQQHQQQQQVAELGGCAGSLEQVAAAALPQRWLLDLSLPAAERHQLLGLAGGPVSTVRVEEISPCWVAVAEQGQAAPESTPDGGADAEPGSGLQQARLPPLRFFLPSADSIEAAYPLAA